MNAPALTRRESLWADEPVMRDGKCLDLALKAMGLAASVQDELLCAVRSPSPNVWRRDAETHATNLLEHIRSMRAVLKTPTKEIVS